MRRNSLVALSIQMSPADLGPRVAIARHERERQLRARRIAAHVRKYTDAMPAREPRGEEDLLVRPIEIFGAIIVPLEVAVLFEHAGRVSEEGAFAGAAAQRRVHERDRAVRVQLSLEAEPAGGDHSLIAGQRARFERGADFGPCGLRAGGGAFSLLRARLTAQDVDRAERIRCTETMISSKRPDSAGAVTGSVVTGANPIRRMSSRCAPGLVTRTVAIPSADARTAGPMAPPASSAETRTPARGWRVSASSSRTRRSCARARDAVTASTPAAASVMAYSFERLNPGRNAQVAISWRHGRPRLPLTTCRAHS